MSCIEENTITWSLIAAEAEERGKLFKLMSDGNREVWGIASFLLRWRICGYKSFLISVLLLDLCLSSTSIVLISSLKLVLCVFSLYRYSLFLEMFINWTYVFKGSTFCLIHFLVFFLFSVLLTSTLVFSLHSFFGLIFPILSQFLEERTQVVGLR